MLPLKWLLCCRARLGIVNGIVASGSAVFTMILPILLKYLLAEIGLRNTMRILAGEYAAKRQYLLTRKIEGTAFWFFHCSH